MTLSRAHSNTLSLSSGHDYLIAILNVRIAKLVQKMTRQMTRKYPVETYQSDNHQSAMTMPPCKGQSTEKMHNIMKHEHAFQKTHLSKDEKDQHHKQSQIVSSGKEISDVSFHGYTAMSLLLCWWSHARSMEHLEKMIKYWSYSACSSQDGCKEWGV